MASSTRDLVRGRYSFEERGPLEIKGLGQTTAYLVVAKGDES